MRQARHARRSFVRLEEDRRGALGDEKKGRDYSLAFPPATLLLS